jgi:hypothetical protein
MNPLMYAAIRHTAMPIIKEATNFPVFPLTKMSEISSGTEMQIRMFSA